MRYTSFRFALAPTPAQAALLARHARASRFAYNQCLRLVTDALAAKRMGLEVKVPWSGFDLINAFNGWKKTEDAGRVFVVARDGTVTKHVLGLEWRHEVAAQVLEEAAVDLSRALATYTRTRNGERKGRAGFPRRKRKGRCRDSFRLRNQTDRRTGWASIRVGGTHARSVTLPRIGAVRVHEDTRRLRRLIRPVDHIDPDTGQMVLTPRAKILFATVSRHGDRWYVSLNIEAPICTLGAATSRAATTITAAGSGWTGVWRCSWSPPLRIGPRSGASMRPDHLPDGFAGSGAAAERFHALSRAPATASGPHGVCHASTPVSPISVEASSTRSQVSSSRPTTGCAWKTSPSPTSSATVTSPGQSATPHGRTSPGSWPTSRRGAAGRSCSATAGSRRLGPARAAGWFGSGCG
jgi:hypothetical protein